MNGTGTGQEVSSTGLDPHHLAESRSATFIIGIDLDPTPERCFIYSCYFSYQYDLSQNENTVTAPTPMTDRLDQLNL
jgi:hypothetical protein